MMYIKCTGAHEYSGIESGVTPGARAPPLPCWIVFESLHMQENCFTGRISRAWNGGPCEKSFWSAYVPGVISQRTP